VGAAAAVVIATAPVFLFQVVQPMNDVTVAALWTAVIVLAARPELRAGAIGAVVGLALLVRPNLAATVIPVFIWVCWTARQTSTPWRAPLAFVMCLAPFVFAIAALNQQLYGRVLSSGYGTASDLFSLGHVAGNLRNYGAALMTTQLGFPLLAAAAPVALVKERQAIAWLIGAVASAVTFTYLLYTPYAEWWYLRFLLPILPMLTALSAAVVARAGRHTAALVVVVALVVGVALSSSAARDAWTLHRLEGRFRTAADVAAERLPGNAVFLTVWESGTVKYHVGRQAVLWDSLDPAWLDRALGWLTARGFEPFIILEEWEEPLFRQRFAAHSLVGNVDWPPRFDIDRQVRIFSPADRSRYLAGESIPTEFVRTDR
jgi:hypothetical protein